MSYRMENQRLYLVIELKGEKYPMFIKLSNNPATSITSMSTPLADVTMSDERCKIEFVTHHLIPVTTIDGVKAVADSPDNYGQHKCIIAIDQQRLDSFRLEMLDEGARYITNSRLYYTEKYGVSYES